MTPSKIFSAMAQLFRYPAGQSDPPARRTFVELADLAATDSAEFERVLTEAGVPPAKQGMQIRRRRWSELREFDRTSFDYEAYVRSIEDSLKADRDS